MFQIKLTQHYNHKTSRFLIFGGFHGNEYRKEELYFGKAHNHS